MSESWIEAIAPIVEPLFCMMCIVGILFLLIIAMALARISGISEIRMDKIRKNFRKRQ